MNVRSLMLQLCCLAALAGCAATVPAPPGTVVPEDRLTATVIPGRTTKAELVAAFGTTKSVAFDSGYEAWVYQSPAGGARFAEFVVLIDPKGIVTRTRRRAPALP
jgi:hypothetical protein